jgi:hypothetical protein
MEPTSRHHEVETLFRALVEEHDIPRPDRVEYEPDAVLFLWDRPKLAVFVDFDGPAGGATGTRGAPTGA